MSEQNKKSFWTTLPGIITAIAGLITASSGLVLALHKAGVFDKKTVSPAKNNISKNDTVTVYKSTPHKPDEKTVDITETENDIEEINTNTSLETTNVVWKVNGNDVYTIYVNERAIYSTVASWFDHNSAIVFDTVSKTTYFLRDYKLRTDNKLREAEVLESPTNAFWAHKNGHLSLYQDGKLLSGHLTSLDIDFDKLVYYPKTNTTYYLKDYVKLNDNQLRPAEIIYSETSCFWRKNEQGQYWFYKKATPIQNRTTNSFEGDHLIVTDPGTGEKFRLRDFKKRKPYQVYAVEWY